MVLTPILTYQQISSVFDEDTVGVPAKAGDVVVFYLWTVHGSAVNKSDRWRRIVRIGYSHPADRQLGGQAMGRPGIMVKGITVDVYGSWQPCETVQV